jgi:polyhydroxybutyrate depolymerase
MEAMSGFDPVSDRNGFAVAYPTALNNDEDHTLWHSYFNGFTFRDLPDDENFIRRLIQTLQAGLKPDPRRIYVAGFSSGGFMASRIGNQTADVVAAIGVVSGSLAVIPEGMPSVVPPPSGPVSVVAIHGGQDQAIAYCGAVKNGTRLLSQDEAFDYWSGRGRNSCAKVTPSAPLCIAGQVNESVATKQATACRAGTEVKIYRVNRGEHVWNEKIAKRPGSQVYNPDLPTDEISTAELLWHFFQSHPRHPE